jgi:hypothetical protein
MSCLKVVMKSIKTAKGGKNTDDDFLFESLHLMIVENLIVDWITVPALSSALPFLQLLNQLKTAKSNLYQLLISCDWKKVSEKGNNWNVTATIRNESRKTCVFLNLI